MTPTNLSIARDADAPLPVTYGRLMDFPDDPVACMRRLHAEHGEICAMEEDGQRIYFIFGPHYNHEVLSDMNNFHSRFTQFATAASELRAAQHERRNS